MTARLDAPRTRWRGLLGRRLDRVRPPAPVDHRRGRLAPADGHPSTSASTSRSTARSSTSASSARACDYPFRTRATPRCCSRCTSATGARSVERLRGPVRLRDPRRRRPVAVPRPARRAAAVHLPGRPTCSRSPPRSRRCSRRSRPAPSVDLASLDSYLSRRAVAAPHTLFENVRKLLPGPPPAGRARPGASSPSPTGPCPTGRPALGLRRRGRRPGVDRPRGRRPQRARRRRAGRARCSAAVSTAA